MSRPPNVIVILADDLGYGDLGCDGGKVIKTPELDRMADEGVRLSDFYASANVCTPSRAGLLTGQFAIRHGLGRYQSQRNPSQLPDVRADVRPGAIRWRRGRRF